MKLRTTRQPPRETVMRFGAPADVWDETPESRAFVELRKEECQLTAAEAAERLGLTVPEFNELEFGGRVCDWAEAAHRLRQGGKGTRKRPRTQ